MPRITEFKHALRSLYKRRTYSLIIIIVLALGIGANTAIFSVVNSVLLQPLPFDQPDRLVYVWHIPPPKSFPGFTKFAVSPANFLDWQAQNHVLESMALYGGGDFTLTGYGDPQPINGRRVGPEFFSVLRVNPLKGRIFSDEDGKGDNGKVVVISEPFWRAKLNADPNMVGKTLRISEEPYTVVGIIPAKAIFPPDNPAPEVWTCLQWDAKERAVRGNHNYLGIGRLKPGVTIAQANSELSIISQRLQQQYPADDAGWGAKVVPMREELVGDVRPALLVLLGAVAFVLLIACANVMNLVLATTLARRKELAIRTALGASRADLIRQVLIETVTLSLAGGLLGICFAHFGINLIVNFLADQLPRMHEIGLNITVLLFTLIVSVVAGLVAGIFPAWRFAKADINDALKQGLGKTDSDSGGMHARNVLVVAEVALSLMLLVGAGLMIRTFYHLQHVDIGIDPHNELTMTVPLPKSKYAKPDQQRAAAEQILNKVRTLPGVELAAAVDSLPLQGGSTQPILIEGRPVVQMADQPEVPIRRIGTQYLKAMRIPVLRGRDFTESDSATAPPVILITQSLAREFFPNEDPIGKHVSLELTDKYLELPMTPREIVGIVGDAKLGDIESDHSMSAVYMPWLQTPGGGFTLVVRTSGDPSSLTSAVTGAVHSVDPAAGITDILTMDQVVASAMAQRRFNMYLLVAFAALALVLAAVGIYSVLSYAVRRRVREIGIRMALGAQVRDVVQMVMIDGMKPTALGVLIGFAGALALGKILASVIYGVSARDSVTFGTVCLLLLTVALVASLFPAYRAAQVEPVRTLRDE
jgi:putative ABC transport system permease protein